MPKQQTHGNVARLDRVCGIKEKAVNGGSTKLRAGHTNGLRIGNRSGWIGHPLARHDTLEVYQQAGDGRVRGVHASQRGLSGAAST